MTEKKSVLIISYYFAPQNVIGAVRPTKLAKYLSRMGHEVTVVCGTGLRDMCDPTLARDFQELSDVHVVREWNPLRGYKARQSAAEAKSPTEPGQGSPKTRNKKSLKGRALDFLYLLICFLADKSFAMRGFCKIRGMRRRFDVVLSSYGPISALQIAKKVKAKGIAARWIADFRDVVEMPFPWQRGYARRLLKKVSDRANVVTGVSEGYLDIMGFKQSGVVITNGFDAEDLRGCPLNAEARPEKLTFLYCGQMYGSQRDMRPFFTALRELIREGVIAEEKLELGFAGKALDAGEFAAQATACGLGARVQGHGLVTRDRAIELQRSADAILVAAWNFPEWTGNLPGKLLEVLMMERPVICCVSGDIPGSEAARLIRETEIGFCYEQAEGQHSYAELKAYLRGLLTAFESGRPFPFASNAEKMEQYAYHGIAKRFSALL